MLPSRERRFQALEIALLETEKAEQPSRARLAEARDRMKRYGEPFEEKTAAGPDEVPPEGLSHAEICVWILQAPLRRNREKDLRALEESQSRASSCSSPGNESHPDGTRDTRDGSTPRAA